MDPAHLSYDFTKNKFNNNKMNNNNDSSNNDIQNTQIDLKDSSEHSNLSPTKFNSNNSKISIESFNDSGSSSLNNSNSSSKNPSENNSPNYYGIQSSLNKLEREEIFRIKESIVFAVSKMNMCDIPLRRQVFESLIDKQTMSSKQSFKEFLKIESCKTLYPIEEDRLEELKKACIFFRNPYKEIVNANTDHLTDAIRVTEAAIRRLIQMSNKLGSFNRLSQVDKIALLKSSIIEMFCIRATTNFNAENNFWYFIDDRNKGLSLVSMEILKAAQINFLSHKEFAIKYQSEFSNDNIIADLLTVIILFRPTRAAVSAPDVVNEEFLNYCYLLRRYLQVKHNGNSCEAKSSFITLMYRLEELFHLSEDIVRIYMNLNPQNAGQLFVELFDLS